MRELSWLCQAGVFYVFIADANWGMKKRDVDLSRHLARGKQRFGAPGTVYFCGSKNNPDRVAEITGIFHDAGMVATQSITLQTTDAQTLVNVDRGNIRTETYTRLQERLNADGISSFIEMTWPLPGETPASYKKGIGELCERGAQSFVVNPLLLMNNVALADKREQYGLVTLTDPDPDGEAEIVVGTHEVGEADYREGVRFSYAVTSLDCLRALWCLGRYLDATGRVVPLPDDRRAAAPEPARRAPELRRAARRVRHGAGLLERRDGARCSRSTCCTGPPCTGTHRSSPKRTTSSRWSSWTRPTRATSSRRRTPAGHGSEAPSAPTSRRTKRCSS